MTIEELEDKIRRKKEIASYLYGKKKGIWHRETQADIKRSEEIRRLEHQLKHLKDAKDSIVFDRTPFPAVSQLRLF